MTVRRLALAAVVALAAVSPALAASKPAPAAPPAEEPKTKSLADTVKGLEKVSGLLTFYRSPEKLYLEVPAETLGAPLGFSTVLVNAAGDWLARAALTHPLRWRPAPERAERWEQRVFDRWQPLDPSRPVIHVNAFEAEACARWAGRRLPTAAEWEVAARQHGFAWGGSVWEWTADDFLPYPGFAPGPYRDYSQPWFGSHRELRGGAFATPARLHHPAFRNFFLPQRCDVFAGFRTAASR